MAQTSWKPRDLDKLRQDIGQLFDLVRETYKGDEDLGSLRREINHILDHVWEWQKEEAWGDGTWNPMVDVADEGKKILVAIELPGIKQKDVTVNTDGDMLTIQGEKKPSEKGEKAGMHQAERVFGSFSRSLRLPARVKSSKVKAEFKNGVLLLQMKKTKKAGRQGIELEKEKERAGGKAKAKKARKEKDGPGKGKSPRGPKPDAQTTQTSPVPEAEPRKQAGAGGRKSEPKKARPPQRRKSAPLQADSPQGRKSSPKAKRKKREGTVSK